MPFEKIVTDITQFNVRDSPVLDLFNREVISYSISISPNLNQIREMLNGLFEKLPAGAIPTSHSATKVGNIITQNTSVHQRSITLHKVCYENVTVWITEPWKTSSEETKG